MPFYFFLFSPSLVRSFIDCSVRCCCCSLAEIQTSLSFVGVLVDLIPSYKVQAGWVLVFVVWLWVVDDLSSILCRSGSSLAFPNMMMVVEVGWLMMIACHHGRTDFLFVAAGGQCHSLVPGRQGQIVVYGGSRRGGHMRTTF